MPVISGDTNSIFSSSPFLKELLTEPRIDDQSAIYRRASRAVDYVAKNREFFEKAVTELFEYLDAKARRSWECLVRSTYKVPMCVNGEGVCVIATDPTTFVMDV